MEIKRDVLVEKVNRADQVMDESSRALATIIAERL
jgi:hypothetical protein